MLVIREPLVFAKVMGLQEVSGIAPYPESQG